MVRLKVDYFRLATFFLNISIPYGAIKSFLSRLAVCFLIAISIPYGAIKRNTYHYNSYDLMNFNSLWCD